MNNLGPLCKVKATLGDLALGENNTALDLLEKAYQERSGCLVVLKVQHEWDLLRAEPRTRWSFAQAQATNQVF